MKLTFKRLTKPSQVLKLWAFFLEGLREIALRGGELLDEECMQKTLCLDAAEWERAFVCVGYSNGEPQGFGVFEECTPVFAKHRSFVTRVFFHKTGNKDLSVGILNEFETWAKAQGVKWHIVSTRRKSGSAVRLFTGPRYGFKQSCLVFEKELT